MNNDDTLLSIIIPAYNEESGINQVLKELCNSNDPYLKDAEIIVVDDGSWDNTCNQVTNFERIRLLKHRFNKGYGASLVTGIQSARGKFVVWFDADGQHRLEDLITVTHTLIEEDLDYCIGVRDQTSYQEPARVFGKLILKLVVQIVAQRSVTDFNSGLRGFKRNVISRYLHILPKGFGASTYTTLLMMERGYYGKEVKIFVQRRVGKSSVKIVRDGFRTLMIILRIVLLFSPLRFWGGLGILFFSSGLIYGIIKTILDKNLGFPVFATLVIMLGIQSLLIGLLSDQISILRLEQFEHNSSNE
jgi:glycosyltransferase involved in cell wall biosynthesis